MAHPVDVYVGQRLKLRRSILAMSQETLARSVGITFQQVQKYERGVNRMGASRLHDFAQALGIDVGFFFDGYEAASGLRMSDSREGGFEHERLPSREMLEFARLLGSVEDAKQRKALIEIARAMATVPAAA